MFYLGQFKGDIEFLLGRRLENMAFFCGVFAPSEAVIFNSQYVISPAFFAND